MNIDDKTLNNIATLSMLEIKKTQSASLKKDISSILSMIEQINEINTDHITPLSHPLETKQFLREDKIDENHLKKDIQKLSTNIENDLYIVAKVID